MENRRILFCVSGYRVFGSETKMLYIMRYLKEKGFDVRCVTQGWSDDRFSELLVEENIQFYKIKLGFLYLTKPRWTVDTVLHYPKAILALKSIIKEFNPHIFYHNSFKNLFMMLPFLPKEKIVFHVGDVHALTTFNRFVFNFIDKRVFKIIASSQFIKKNLQDLGVTQPIPVVPNGIELPKGRLRSTKSNNIFKVGMVAQLIERKGQKDLLMAVKNLYELGVVVYCYFYGSGDEKYLLQLKSIVEEYKIQGKVFFKGYEQSKEKIYNELDVCIVSSRSEAFGISAVEPMFYKIPVVSTNVGGLKEIVDHGRSGFLYEPGDVRNLTLYLQKLIQDKELRDKIVEGAYLKATDKFTVSKMVNSIMKEFPQYG